MTISSCAETAEQCPTAGQQLSPSGKASRANLEPCPSGLLIMFIMVMAMMMVIMTMAIMMVIGHSDGPDDFVNVNVK